MGTGNGETVGDFRGLRRVTRGHSTSVTKGPHASSARDQSSGGPTSLWQGQHTPSTVTRRGDLQAPRRLRAHRLRSDAASSRRLAPKTGRTFSSIRCSTFATDGGNHRLSCGVRVERRRRHRRIRQAPRDHAQFSVRNCPSAADHTPRGNRLNVDLIRVAPI